MKAVTPSTPTEGIGSTHGATLFSNEKIFLFGIPLHNMSPVLRFLFLASTLMILYIFSGITFEKIFVSYPGFQFGLFITWCQFIMNFLSSGYQYFVNLSTPPSVLPLHDIQSSTPQKSRLHMFLHEVQHFFSRVSILYFIATATLTILGMGLANQGLLYLNYPTKMLFKSSKLLFIMLFGIFILKKQYPWSDYLASFFLIVGLVLLHTANIAAELNFHFVGMALMSAALMSDAVLGNLQDKLLRQCNVTPNELIFFTYSIGTILLLVICIIMGQFFQGLLYCYMNPSIILYIFATTFLTFLGVNFVHTCTKLYGILVTATITTLRKAISIMLSFVIFPKPFVLGHALAILFIFAGTLIRIYAKNEETIHAWIRKHQRA